MDAFHTFWSKPNRLRHGGRVAAEDCEVLTMILSALKWQEKNGAVRMVTDRAGAAFFKSLSLENLWSAPIDESLEDMDESVDAELFWAAGKLEALRRVSAPCVMLDTDLIVWQPLSEKLGGNVVAAHREPLNPTVYPDPRRAFGMARDYAFPTQWDFSLLPVNTAFLYMPDDAIRRAYTDAAFRFMAALRRGAGAVATMCFAEQRILPMCAAASGAQVDTLLREDALDGQELATHLWGAKRTFAADVRAGTAYCVRCALRIERDFPRWGAALAANDRFGMYFAPPSARNGEEGSL